MTSFSEFGLLPQLSAGLSTAGYTIPTPIQAAAVPPALEGRDVLGLAQTGTGKTVAFTLPLLQALARTGGVAAPGAPRALILLPTRELALQVEETIGMLGARLALRSMVVHGGVSPNPQIRGLSAGTDILVATPGRLIDLMNQGKCTLASVEFFVLDEADRMLDMGFLPDVRRVLAKLPSRRQTLFFSATMPDPVAKLAGGLLRNHVRVQVAAPATTVERIEQSVVMVDPSAKAATLIALLSDPAVTRAIVFTRTKHGANKLVAQLAASGIQADAYHANKSQPARERALNAFRTGASRALVATDIAARGIDVDGVSHVFNYDLPEVPEAYVHRIGRTGRAGRAGVAVSLCAGADRPLLAAIEKLIRLSVPRREVALLPASALPPLPVRPTASHQQTPAAPGRNAQAPGQGRRRRRSASPNNPPKAAVERPQARTSRR